MAYITTANSKRIIRKIDFNSITFTGEVYKKPIYFFSRYEEQSLLAIKELLENPEHFFDEYYDVLVNEDSYQYVFESGRSAYHKSLNCPKLHSDFQNFEIPKEIKDRGNEEVKKYRAWFKDAAYLLEEDDENKIEIFKERCRLRFNLDLPPDFIKMNNSGSFEIENLKLDELEDKIDCLLKESGMTYYRSEKHTTILKRFSKLTFLASKPEPIYNNQTGYSDKEVKEILREYAEKFKSPLIHLLREWYRVKLNPDLTFDGELLEKLSFVSCGTCFNPDFDPEKKTENISACFQIDYNLPIDEDLPF